MYPHSVCRMCTKEDIGNQKKANASVAMGTATVVFVSQKREMHIFVFVCSVKPNV